MELDLAPACNDPATGNAAPGIRLRKFTQSFPNNTIHAICQANLAAAMAEIGKKLAGILTNTCVTQPLVDTDLSANGIQADCQVVDRVPRDDSPTGYRDTPLPRCAGNADALLGAARPTAPAARASRPSSAGATPSRPPNTLQSIRCLTCADNSQDERCIRAP